jgi:aminopeptidase
VGDPRVERLAKVLVDYSTDVSPGQLVLIETTPLAGPLLTALFRRILEAGGHPQVRLGLDGAGESLLERGSDEQLEWVSPARREEFERADARIQIDATSNTRHLSGVDPARQARMARARQPLRDRYLERAAAGELHSVVTLFPTNSNAQDAAMSLTQYEDFVYRAGLIQKGKPGGERKKPW